MYTRFHPVSLKKDPEKFDLDLFRKVREEPPLQQDMSGPSAVVDVRVDPLPSVRRLLLHFSCVSLRLCFLCFHLDRRSTGVQSSTENLENIRRITVNFNSKTVNVSLLKNVSLLNIYEDGKEF